MSEGDGKRNALCKNCGATTRVTPTFAFWRCTFCDRFDQVGEFVETESVPRNLKYTAADQYKDISLIGLVGGLSDKSPLWEPVSAFSTNVISLRSMLRIPIDVAWQAKVFSEIYTTLAIQERANPSVSDDEVADMLGDKAIEMMKKWYAENLPDRIAGQEEIGRQIVNAFSVGTIQWMGQESLLIAQLTGLWSAIETLAGDLWIAAVNACPMALAELRGKSARISLLASGEKTEAKAQDDDGPKGMQVSRQLMQQLTRGRYDLQHKMGYLLSDKFTFTKLAGIREAYSRAFWEHSEKIDAALSHASLDVLSTVRNVFIHRAGFIDTNYETRCRALPDAPKGAVGEKIKLDGEVVNALARPALLAAIDLVKSVESRIASIKKQEETRGNE